MSIQEQLAQQLKQQNCDKSYAQRITHNLPRDMYDKILRHRQTIEAALASEDHGGRDLPHQRGVSLNFDNVQGSLTVQADLDEDLEKANRLINLILSDDSLGDSLGLTDLTTESLLAKMEAPSLPSCSRINQKLPLGTASSWDAATGKPRSPRPRYVLNHEEAKRILLSSPLPNEMCVGAMPAGSYMTSGLPGSTSTALIFQSPHMTVTKAISDPYVQYLQPCVISTNLENISLSDRRKLESEDSSYGSDHENNRGWTNHDDVSRQTSETLGVEFTEYVNVESSNSTKDLSDHYDGIEDILADKNYETKVTYAIRRGYSEQHVQQALLKLGRKAGEDQFLEELIRLQKTTKIEDQPCDLKSQRLNDTVSQVNCKDEQQKTMLEAAGAILLPIIIDGSNVAMSHGNKKNFSCKGIRICVDWFQKRGHKEIYVFVPLWRKEPSKPETPITDQHILTDLEKENILKFSPSRQWAGRRIVCHDDRYILNLAVDIGGIVVSNDNYRELIHEKPNYKEVIENRILMYSFVNDRFMPPDDPLGRNGPTLDHFLRKKVKSAATQSYQPCPYGKKCTYGNKCKFYHPDRVTNQKSITERLKENSSQKISEMRARVVNSRDSSPGDPLTRTRSMQPKTVTKQCVSRTKSSNPRLIHMWAQQPQQPQPQNFQQGQQHLPVFDATMPPPPPRGPWNNEPPNDLQSKTHKKVSRQMSLNPTYDPRIHGLPKDFSVPPPPLTTAMGPPPPSSASQHHMTVTRNASAPEGQQPGPGFPGALPNATSMYAATSHAQNDLHKTVSWSADMSGAVSPLITGGNVWDSNTNSANDTNPRSNLYYHLAKIFPENKVRIAMSSLPDETNPDVICQHIIAMKCIDLDK